MPVPNRLRFLKPGQNERSRYVRAPSLLREALMTKACPAESPFLAAGIADLSRDAASEVQPRFGDEEKTRFVGVCRPFCQIKARGGQSPVLEFQTHFRTQSTSWRGLEKSQLSSQNITERPRFHARGHYQLNRARKILSIHELIANLNLRQKI
jgi:hypothetical protein